MQANSIDDQSFNLSTSGLDLSPVEDISNRGGSDGEPDTTPAEPIHFSGFYTSCMEMWADAATVEAYLNSHREWFQRCASPMTAEPLGENGYALTIGKFGALGYEVEPKIGLDLLPQDAEGVYRIETIPVPDYEPPGYDVDFQASLHMVEQASQDQDGFILTPQVSPRMTRVEWDLHLDVAIHFPRFIYALPKPFIQSTGDRLLNQIVRQVSRCLTHKVQEDFHHTRGLSFPKKARKYPWSRHHATAPDAESGD